MLYIEESNFWDLELSFFFFFLNTVSLSQRRVPYWRFHCNSVYNYTERLTKHHVQLTGIPQGCRRHP